MFLSNTKSSDDQNLPALSDANLLPAVKNLLIKVEKAQELIRPDTQKLKESIGQQLKKYNKETPVASMAKVRISDLDTLPLNRFKSLNEYSKYDHTMQQGVLMNKHDFRQSLDVLMNSETMQKRFARAISKPKSKELKAYIKELSKKVFYLTEKGGLGINYDAFEQEYSDNYLALTNTFKKANDLSEKKVLTHARIKKIEKIKWGFLLKQIFLEAFIASNYSHVQLGVFHRVQEHLRSSYRKLLNQNLIDKELKTLLIDMKYWYGINRQDYSFFQHILKKEIRRDRVWARRIVRSINAIASKYKSQRELPVSSIFSLKQKSFENEKALSEALRLERVNQILEEIEISYRSKNIETLSELSNLAFQLNEIVSQPDYPVIFRLDHPSVLIVSGFLKNGTVNKNMVSHEYMIQTMQRLFNQEAAQNRDYEYYFVLSGYHELKNLLWSLRDDLLQNQSLFQKILSNPQAASDLELNIAKTVESHLSTIDDLFKNLSELKDEHAQWLSNFDTSTLMILEHLKKLRSALSALHIGMVPNLTREMINDFSDETEKLLDESRIKYLDYMNNLTILMSQNLKVIRGQLKLLEQSASEKELEKISEIGNSLERFFEEVSHRQVNLSYKEFYSLRHMVETFYYANGLKNIENKNFFIELGDLKNFNKLISEIFNITKDHADPSKRISSLRIVFPESRFVTGERSVLKNAIRKNYVKVSDQLEKMVHVQNQSSIAIKNILKPLLNGEGDKKYSQIFLAIARMALFLGESDADRITSFYIHFVPNAVTKEPQLRISRSEQYSPNEDLSWLFYALASYHHIDSETKKRTDLSLPIFNRPQMFNQALASKVLNMQFDLSVYRQNKRGSDLTQYVDEDESHETIFSRPFRTLEEEEKEQFNLFEKISSQISDLGYKFKLSGINLKKIFNFYGITGSRSQKTQTPYLSPKKETQIKISLPQKINGSETPASKIRVVAPLEEKPGYAEFDLDQLLKTMGESSNKEVVLKIDPEKNKITPTLKFSIKNIPGLENCNAGAADDVWGHFVKKHAPKFVIHEIRNIAIELRKEDIMEPLKNPSIAQFIEQLQKMTDNNGRAVGKDIAESFLSETTRSRLLKEYLEKEKFVQIRFKRDRKTVVFNHSNDYDTIEISTKKEVTDRMPIEIVVRKANQYSDSLSLTSLNQDHTFTLKNSMSPSIIFGKGYIKLKKNESLDISIARKLHKPVKE